MAEKSAAEPLDACKIKAHHAGAFCSAWASTVGERDGQGSGSAPLPATLDAIMDASVEQLLQVPDVGPVVAGIHRASSPSRTTARWWPQLRAVGVDSPGETGRCRCCHAGQPDLRADRHATTQPRSQRPCWGRQCQIAGSVSKEDALRRRRRGSRQNKLDKGARAGVPVIDEAGARALVAGELILRFEGRLAQWNDERGFRVHRAHRGGERRSCTSARSRRPGVNRRVRAW